MPLIVVEPLELLFSPLITAFSILFEFWWVYTPFLLLFGTLGGWQSYTTRTYLKSVKWVLLEIQPPPEVVKSPKIAEYMFAHLHTTQSTPSWRERFFQGKVADWFSFEIVSSAGQPHFYIRTPETARNIIESQIFAQYPTAEISVVTNDYINDLPADLPDDQYNLFGAELVFAKADGYPIVTHPSFEEMKGEDVESYRTDPLSVLFESLSLLGSQDHVWIQYIIRPASDDWTKEVKAEIEKLMGKKEGVTPSMANVTPGTREVILAIEKKTTKLGYQGGIRFAYIGPNNNFNKAHISGVTGFFKQFSSPTLNSFKPNGDIITKSKGFFYQIFPSEKGFFASQIEYKRKRKLYRHYRERKFVSKPIILNIEELATLFHLPGSVIKSPLFPRVESKKSQPPTTLPVG